MLLNLAAIPPHADRPTGRVHLIGIAGSGMRSMAQVLAARGWEVSGSDAKFDAGCFRLAEDIDLVIYSDAIPTAHPERQSAALRGIETISYPQMLGRLMGECQMNCGIGLAVAGTHGKSTTSAMAAEILHAANIHSTCIFGAEPIESPAILSQKQHNTNAAPTLLVEACEYRENFRFLRPQAAVILNVEPDHFDYFANGAAVEAAFASFARQVVAGGTLVVSANCPAALRVGQATACQQAGISLVTFGIEVPADWQARNLEHSGGKFAFDLCCQREKLGRVRMAVPGKHNVANALAAAALASSAGASIHAILAGISSFSGLKRRLQRLGTIAGVPWIDDFAHHPTEISAALETVRQMVPAGRLWCVFQPHQVSRTEALLDEFASSLQNTDTVLVTDIYRAREGPPRPGEVGPAELAARIRALGGNVSNVHSMPEIEMLFAKAIVDQSLGPGDVLVTLGAGNVESIAHGLVQRFRECRAAG